MVIKIRFLLISMLIIATITPAIFYFFRFKGIYENKKYYNTVKTQFEYVLDEYALHIENTDRKKYLT